ncbi:ABC transporter permease, partial [Nocardioides sp.]|uniref:ABC transporter permease n=1 Tax=Nocardioides sp. TaxID=35761 RepID=UPI0035677CD6
MRRFSAWRLPLLLAWRDAARAKGRSALVLAMIALPVLAVTAALVVQATADVDGVESLDRRLGAADARVVVQPGVGQVFHDVDPDNGISGSMGEETETPTLAEVRALLGGSVPVLEMRPTFLRVVSGKGVADAEGLEVDLADPLASGLVDLTAGRLPQGTDEVVVNQALADKGYAVGERLEIVGGGTGGLDATRTPTIVGLAESTSWRSQPFAAGPLGALAPQVRGPRTWLVGGGPVGWEQVRALNAIGATVLSRAVLLDPPPASALPPELQHGFDDGDNTMLAVVVLIVVMALLEVVLLAGPAFAVSARRQSRNLALIAAAGGSPAQARRVILAGGVVLGGLAATLGVVLGVAAGWALIPLVQRWSSSWFGPLDLPWLRILGVACFGLASALIAAVVPAWIASRQDVVAVLAGRRGDRAASLRSPFLGLALLAVGIAGAAFGARQTGGGELWIAASAILSVLGMILLVPVVLVALARVSGRLPLSLRYSVRDAARHRTRTVPAVAAVAATVAGVVALGIATTSDAAENKATYSATLPMGEGMVSGYGVDPALWSDLVQAAVRELPGVSVARVRGIAEDYGTGG